MGDYNVNTINELKTIFSFKFSYRKNKNKIQKQKPVDYKRTKK